MRSNDIGPNQVTPEMMEAVVNDPHFYALDERLQGAMRAGDVRFYFPAMKVLLAAHGVAERTQATELYAQAQEDYLAERRARNARKSARNRANKAAKAAENRARAKRMK